MSVIVPRALLRQARLLACALLLLSPAQTLRAAETGDPSEARQQALDLVNAARREHGREPLTLSGTLNEAAQAHAEDMLARGYYGHVSPEGEDARDRYLARGGDRWALVAENIARCSPCAGAPDLLQEFMRRWMESPEHRENILRRGVTQFGFGIAVGENGSVFAVQTFAGPGSARGGGDGEGAEPLAAGGADRAFATALNARREGESLPPLEVNPVLSEMAARLLPDSPAEELGLGPEGGLMAALPSEAQGDWRWLSALAGSCGGCGDEPTGEDVRFFLEQWLEGGRNAEQLFGREPSAVGFALRAYGNGRKAAVAVLGQRR